MFLELALSSPRELDLTFSCASFLPLYLRKTWFTSSEHDALRTLRRYPNIHSCRGLRRHSGSSSGCNQVGSLD